MADKTINPQQPAKTQIEDYLRYCRLNREMTSDTIKTKYYHLARYARDNNIKNFCKVTNLQIDDWRAEMYQAGASKKTINNHVDDVAGCAKFLRNRQNKPIALRLEAVERYLIRYDNEDLPSFSPREIVAIRKHCKTLLEQLTVSMIFESAMRLHELTYLRVEDIRRLENGKEYYRILGKGKKKRNTFVLAQTKVLLDSWLTLTGIETSYVFPSPAKEGRPYSTNQMRKIITRPIRRAGFDIGTPQALRRSAVSIALDNGMPVPHVTKWVGHSDPRVTFKHYYRQNNKLLQDSHESALSEAFAFAQ